MTIIVERLLWCDGGRDCPYDEPGNNDDGKQGVTNDQVRARAAANGWIKRGTKDYCEACAARLGFTK